MKKTSLNIILVLILFCLTTSCSDTPNDPELLNENTQSNASEITTDTSIYTELIDVKYGPDDKQTYDAYLPKNRTLDTKVLILVHGGGWVQGDKADLNDIKDTAIRELPEYAIININYRLAGLGISPFPMQLNDITSVINHLKNKQDEYSISSDFGFIGTSAGAHLSMLWSYAYDIDNDINVTASIVGPTNLADPAYNNNPELPVPLIMQGFGINPTRFFLEQFSPYYNVKTTSAPTILFYGGQDPLIPNSQGDNLSAKLELLGVAHEYTFYENEGHGWAGDNLLDTWTKLKAFITTHH